MSKTQERERKILEALDQKKKMSIDEATTLLAISLSSARRLFIEMENSGKVVRTHGGIHLVSTKGSEYSFMELESRNLSAKQQISACAAELLADDDVVYFDSGTTLLQLAIAVKARLQGNALRRIKVITNSFANLEVLQDSCHVILIGGEYHSGRKAFAGYPSEKFVQNFIYKKAFLGADGLDLNEGFMTTDTDTAKLNEVVIKRSDASYVLLDSSKFGLRSFVSYASVSEIKAIITDKDISGDILAQCARANLEILVARPGE
jgi:DeoR family transcriptional regulator, fructose operon transcriptional repressor